MTLSSDSRAVSHARSQLIKAGGCSKNIPITSVTNDLLASIKSRQEELDGKRPLLTSYPMRMPVGIKHQLKRAAKKTGYTQTDIILELLRKALPVILAEDGIQEKLDLA